MDQNLTQSSKILTARCYCKAVHITITVPLSSLPMPTHICHCSICRYSSGAPCVFHAQLPKGVKPQFIAPSSEDELISYRHPASSCVRKSCKSCGCSIGDIGVEDGEWMVSSSIFEESNNNEPKIWDTKLHVFTNSGPEGLAEWMTHIGGRKMKKWNPDNEAQDPPAGTSRTPEGNPADEERLRVQCHCGGVSFTIQRPTEEAFRNDQLRKYVSPKDKMKWKAVVDACDDCRLVSGSHFNAWVFVPLCAVEPSLGPDMRIGTMETFESSPGITRGFCGRCGATAVYYKSHAEASEEEQCMCVSLGLLRAPEGVTALNWLTWNVDKVDFVEDGRAYDRELTGALEAGLKKWGVDTYGEAMSFDIDY